jgi:hypothetical protein
MNPVTDETPVLQRAMSFTPTRWLLEYGRFDVRPPHSQPVRSRLAAAVVASVVGSLVADALLVAIGTVIFPSTRGYVHFQFSDYARLTIVGVLIACAGWPVVTRLSAAPRWVFLRLAVLASAVLLLPDLAILYLGAPVQAVLVLLFMHAAIAVVTYNALVRLAPAHGVALSPGQGRQR